MFDTSDTPRVFGLAPGVDFPAALVAGLRARMVGCPPEDMARVRLIVNTRRMQRRIRAIFDQGPPSLLPRIQLVTDLGREVAAARLPRAVSPLQRRFELIELVSRLLDAQPDLAARASIYDLADSLAGLFDEMSGEGVSPDTIEALDVSDLSGHWARAQAFFAISRRFVGDNDDLPSAEARQRRVVEVLADHWQSAPLNDPVILAGSTGSRGTTMLLMEAVARLPQGAIVLPGFDVDMPDTAWAAMANDKGDGLGAEDHPQFRFHKLATRLNLPVAKIAEWHATPAPAPSRNKLVSLALRPAPVTDQWLAEGPSLDDPVAATNHVTLLQAQSMRQEALAIAMRMRAAAESGQTAALITPDRMLTRQVSAALDQWGIRPDDSAGTPLQLSPPGRFLRHVVALFHRKVTSEAVLTLLKHPLCHSGHDRAQHLLNTRELELHIRKKGIVQPDEAALRGWATGQKNDVTDWTDWVVATLCTPHLVPSETLAARLEAHITRAEAIANGPGPGAGALWLENPGREADKLVRDLRDNADFAGDISAGDYGDLFGAVMAGREVRDRDAGHARILIWGTLEARVQGADLVILGGLNEGSWPETPAADPWLNRQMRFDAGLLLPERRIGLSAHDFQQAIAAPEVWLTRSVRSDESETVPSRWLNRILNLLSGLTDNNGPAAVAGMTARGDKWLALGAQLESYAEVPPAPRPAPRPPVASRPRRLSVTEIRKLIRDPYAIYARHVLGLRPLDSLMKTPDALLRGIVVHDVLEQFVKDAAHDPALLTPAHLAQISEAVLAKNVPWPSARAVWKARLDRISTHFIRGEKRRQAHAAPIAFERAASVRMKVPEFQLVGKADRIDRTDDGQLVIYDYKTGTPPTATAQKHFDKQLLLEAVMAEMGGFDDIDPGHVSDAIYIGLGNTPRDVSAPLAETPASEIWEQFTKLIARYMDPEQGFTARRALQKDSDFSDYDQLARFGEWDVTQEPTSEDLT